MCLILFAICPNDDYDLIVAANRDEFYARPSSQAGFWAGSNILAGKDLEAGGTWLGINRQGRFAAVTNFRETPPEPLPPRSRGDLPTHFLAGNADPEAYLSKVNQDKDQFRGFNLLLGQAQHYYYYCNRQQQIVTLQPGCYGLSNQVLDCDWPKVEQGRLHLNELTSNFVAEDLFDLLRRPGNQAAFSNSFIASSDYGTRASTIVTISKSGQVYFEERQFLPEGEPGPTISHQFQIDR